MLKCETCLYKKGIPGNTHIECTGQKVNIFGVSDHGVKQGWFVFPIIYDPVWAEECDGYVPVKYKDISNLSCAELLAVFKLEEKRICEDLSIKRSDQLFEELSQKFEQFPLDKEIVKKLREFVKNLTKRNSIEGILNG